MNYNQMCEPWIVDANLQFVDLGSPES